MRDLWSEENKPKVDWEANGFGDTLSVEVRRECHSCFEDFDTVSRWAKRCPRCKLEDRPKMKKVINTDIKPF